MNNFKQTFLYIKQHKITGKLYFGKTVNDPEKYLGSGTYWKRHITKYGKEHVINLWYCLFLDQESLSEFSTSFSIINNIVNSKEWANQIIENGIDGGSTPGNGNGAYGKKFPNRKPLSEESRIKKSTSLKEHRRLHPRGNSEQQNMKTSETLKRKYASGDIINPMSGKFGEHNPNFGKKHSKESCEIRSQKLSGEGNGMYGKQLSENAKRLKSEKMTGYVYDIVQCPHCHKTGGETGMRRWHFDKCKFKAEALFHLNCEQHLEEPSLQ